MPDPGRPLEVPSSLHVALGSYGVASPPHLPLTEPAFLVAALLLDAEPEGDNWEYRGRLLIRHAAQRCWAELWVCVETAQVAYVALQDDGF